MLKKIDFGSSCVAAGYSGTPLAAKLGIRPGMTVAVVGAPPNYEELLAPLPKDAMVARAPRNGAPFVHLFVRRRKQLETGLRKYRKSMASDGVIWVSWPKRASAVASNITEDTIREVALPLGLVDVKVCAVDGTWSGLKLVIRREFRAALPRRDFSP